MTPTLAATLNGALATTLALFGLICAASAAVCVAWDAWRKWRAVRAHWVVNNGERR